MNPMMMQYPLVIQREPDRSEERIPKRVAAAFELLTILNHKQCPKIVGGDIGGMSTSTQHDGTELEIEEKEAFRASCKLLTAYVNGEYVQSPLEKAKPPSRTPRGS